MTPQPDTSLSAIQAIAWNAAILSTEKKIAELRKVPGKRTEVLINEYWLNRFHNEAKKVQSSGN